MTNKGKTGRANRLKKWIITLGVFFISQLVFIAIDGTFLEPNLNNIGNFASKLVENMLSWFTLYDNPFFKFITMIGVLHIIFTAIKDVIVCITPKKVN